jgi:hypothetical protein
MHLKIYNKQIVIGIIILSFFLISRAESKPKWADYWENKVNNKVSEKRSFSNREIPGIIKSSGLVWIKIYQKGISTQDLPSCVFTPSCSNFAYTAIQELGFMRGWLLAGDRLLRCNPFAKNYYPKYYSFTGRKLLDPINIYQFGD